jgi:hypothetical protein
LIRNACGRSNRPDAGGGARPSLLRPRSEPCFANEPANCWRNYPPPAPRPLHHLFSSSQMLRAQRTLLSIACRYQHYHGHSRYSRRQLPAAQAQRGPARSTAEQEEALSIKFPRVCVESDSLLATVGCLHGPVRKGQCQKAVSRTAHRSRTGLAALSMPPLRKRSHSPLFHSLRCVLSASILAHRLFSYGN